MSYEPHEYGVLRERAESRVMVENPQHSYSKSSSTSSVGEAPESDGGSGKASQPPVKENSPLLTSTFPLDVFEEELESGAAIEAPKRVKHGTCTQHPSRPETIADSHSSSPLHRKN